MAGGAMTVIQTAQVKACMQPYGSLTGIALKHSVNDKLLRKWVVLIMGNHYFRFSSNSNIQRAQFAYLKINLRQIKKGRANQ
jgi:transposase-like protein